MSVSKASTNSTPKQVVGKPSYTNLSQLNSLELSKRSESCSSESGVSKGKSCSSSRKTLVLKDGRWVIDCDKGKTTYQEDSIECSSCCKILKDGHKEGVKQGIMVALDTIEQLLPRDLLKLYEQRYKKLLAENTKTELKESTDQQTCPRESQLGGLATCSNWHSSAKSVLGSTKMTVTSSIFI